MLEIMINRDVIREASVAPNTMLLAYLRERKGLTGTKEGCGSGDCGACTVVVADLDQDAELRYRQINACITPVNALHGKQIITVEHLKQGKKLHPVQQIVADAHGSQCGFCTPGFVMSLYSLSKQKNKPEKPESYLSGNLCRCTGYGPLIGVARKISTTQILDPAQKNEDEIKAWMKSVSRQETENYLKPINRQELALAKKEYPNAWLIAGGTNLSLEFTQKYKEVDALIDLSTVDDLQGITQTATGWRLGAAVSLAEVHQFMSEQYPTTDELLDRLGSLTIRNRGTLGGSLGNASPIGDIAPLVISLGGQIEIDNGIEKQFYAVEDFITGYRVTVLQSDQWISAVHLPRLDSKQKHAIYKISKRAEDDISTVVLALNVTLEADETISDCIVAAGGVAATPVRLTDLEALMKGQSLNPELVAQIQRQVPNVISPMSDVRASAQYRIQLVQNLFQRFYLECNKIDTRM